MMKTIILIIFSALLVSCGQERKPGETEIRLFAGSAATATLDQGIIFYSYSSVENKSQSFYVSDDSAGFNAEVENGVGYQFFAVGAKTLSGGAVADFNQIYCGQGTSGGETVFNLEGNPISLNVTLSQNNCALPIFTASQFLDGSGSVLPVFFTPCTDISSVTNPSATCTAGQTNNLRIEMVADSGGVAFESDCFAAYEFFALMPTGNSGLPLKTRVIAYLSDVSCNSTNTRTFEFPKGLNSDGTNAKSYLDSSSTYIKIYLQE